MNLKIRIKKISYLILVFCTSMTTLPSRAQSRIPDEFINFFLSELKTVRTQQNIKKLCNSFWNKKSGEICNSINWVQFNSFNISVSKITAIDNLNGFVVLALPQGSKILFTYTTVQGEYRLDIDNPLVWNLFSEQWDLVTDNYRFYTRPTNIEIQQVKQSVSRAKNFVENILNVNPLNKNYNSLSFYFVNDSKIEDVLDNDQIISEDRIGALSRVGFIIFLGTIPSQTNGHMYSDSYFQSVIAHELTHEYLNFTKNSIHPTISLIDEGIATFIQVKYLKTLPLKRKTSQDEVVYQTIENEINSSIAFLSTGNVSSLFDEGQFRSNRGFYYIGAGAISFLEKKMGGIKKIQNFIQKLQSQPNKESKIKLIQQTLNEKELQEYVLIYLKEIKLELDLNQLPL